MTFLWDEWNQIPQLIEKTQLHMEYSQLYIAYEQLYNII
jgi:hypothetical protein